MTEPITDEEIENMGSLWSHTHPPAFKELIDMCVNRIRSDADAHASACRLYEEAIAEKDAEIERLREALKKIHAFAGVVPNADNRYEFVYGIRDITKPLVGKQS